MEICIALLRGVNVGGANKLPMRDLRELLAQCGAKHPQTLIQSGNCVFKLQKTSVSSFPAKLTDAVETIFGFRPKVMLMTQEQLQAAINDAPFKPEEPKHLHVWFGEAKPVSPDVGLLERLKSPTEQFELIGNRFYLHAPDGIGRSKLADKVEKALGVAATARNLNTLQKLAALAQI
jgi:uncharacterized protein (DUF1697 family)